MHVAFIFSALAHAALLYWMLFLEGTQRRSSFPATTMVTLVPSSELRDVPPWPAAVKTTRVPVPDARPEGEAAPEVSPESLSAPVTPLAEQIPSEPAPPRPDEPALPPAPAAPTRDNRPWARLRPPPQPAQPEELPVESARKEEKTETRPEIRSEDTQLNLVETIADVLKEEELPPAEVAESQAEDDSEASEEDSLANLMEEALTTGPSVTGADLEAVRLGFQKAMKECWLRDHEGLSSEARVEVHFRLKQDGSIVQGSIERGKASGANESTINTAFRNIRRALEQCSRDGYKGFPPTLYSRWREITMVFEPK